MTRRFHSNGITVEYVPTVFDNYASSILSNRMTRRRAVVHAGNRTELSLTFDSTSNLNRLLR